MFDKLRKIFYLHANLEGLYRLPFKAIFEIEKFYPTAYKVVVDYRNWLVTQIHQLLLTIKATATLEDAYMFLFVIDGARVQLLSKDRIDERDKLLDYFLRKLSIKSRNTKIKSPSLGFFVDIGLLKLKFFKATAHAIL